SREEWAKPFDFEAGRVAHARLLRLAGDEHLLLLTVSALAADSHSLGRLVEELASAYAALSAGADGVERWASADVLQYADYAEWQHELAESEDGEAGREFWRPRQRDDDTDEWRLPHEREGVESNDATADATAYDETEVELSADLTARARASAQVCGVPLRDWLLGCWHALLWRASGGRVAPLLCHFDGRRFEYLQHAVGPLGRFLPLQLNIESDFNFREILQSLGDSLSAAAKWQEYYHAADGDGPDPSQTSPNAVAYAYTESTHTHHTTELTFHPTQPRSFNTSSLLLLNVSSGPDALHLSLRFNTTRFDSEGARRLLSALLALLEQVTDRPHAPARLLPAVGREERDRLVRSRNLAVSPFDPEVCAHHLFERQAATTPDAAAVVCGDDSLTYSELNARANRLARHLRTLGVRPESRVALCLERSVEAVVALLAVLKAGGAYVPLDPHYPRERLSFMLEDSRCRVLLTERRLLSSLPPHSASVVLLDSGDDELSRHPAQDLCGGADASNLAYLIYTSGSAGTPKAVGVAHRQLSHLRAALASAVYSSLGGPLRVSLNAPLSFDASVKQWLQLLSGHCLVVVGEAERGDPERLVGELARRGVEVFDCTPSHLRALLGAGLAGVESLRAVLLGGEAVGAGLWRRLRGGGGGRARYFNLYGPTECTVDASAAEVGGVEGGRGETVGVALGNVRLLVLDGWGGLAPEGGRGELYVGGAGVARGYVGRPSLTAERFVPDAYSGEAGARLYRTGGVARWRGEGRLEYLGRSDEQVKVRGYRVELGEVEAVLGGHPLVGAAAVVARAAGAEGEGEGSEGEAVRLVAYVARARAGAVGAGGVTDSDEQEAAAEGGAHATAAAASSDPEGGPARVAGAEAVGAGARLRRLANG
ncbi:MAG TPA: amino acid adenylation domain-containing protein, partial [Pyrinomonadaceae bacterium]|nr:amino acid adenylation domain-containing protein [Pyrinomonadaceae bacterium]